MIVNELLMNIYSLLIRLNVALNAINGSAD